MFNRWGRPWTGSTWAFRLFQRHHTELNYYYWTAYAGKAALDAQHAATPNNQKTDAVFPLPADDKRRISPEMGAWKDWHGRALDWIRLNSLIAINSYFETYLHHAVTLSVESDPGQLHKCPRSVDGLLFKKRNPAYEIKAARDVTEGRWRDRVTGYRTLFGTVPTALLTAQPELELRRKLRNDIGHRFGRSLREPLPEALIYKRFQTIPHDELKAYMKTIFDVAAAIDQHLGPTHIGNYELLAYFHRNRARLERNASMTYKAVAVELWKLHQKPVAKEFVRGMITYYRSV